MYIYILYAYVHVYVLGMCIVWYISDSFELSDSMGTDLLTDCLSNGIYYASVWLVREKEREGELKGKERRGE